MISARLHMITSAVKALAEQVHYCDSGHSLINATAARMSYEIWTVGPIIKERKC